jgi:hypothetical protein
MNEQWRTIPGFSDYEVSDLGRVLSRRRRQPRILRQARDGKGYMRVTLFGEEKGCGRGGGRTVQVHAVVMSAFVGPRPDGQEIRHLDGDSTRNVLHNLAYGTHAANMQDRVAHGRHPDANKTHCKWNHEFTEANTRIYRGQRYCRTCQARRNAARAAA